MGLPEDHYKDYMSDIVPKWQQERARELANNHVGWLLSILRPLMVEEFKHGFRHGFEEADIANIDPNDLM